VETGPKRRFDGTICIDLFGMQARLETETGAKMKVSKASIEGLEQIEL